jgi:nucleoside-diphosphate-sugar epimerase
MKIVITGALGHIGSKLIRDIPKHLRNHQFVLIDSLITERYSSLYQLPKGIHYTFIHSDIFEIDYSNILRDTVAVIHLAAITDAERSFDREEEVNRINLKGTEIIARACAENNVPLIMISTTSVYGSQECQVDETCEKLYPQSPYASSKLKAELLLKKLSLEKGLRFVILRFGTIFGKSIGMRFHTAVNKFCWQATLKQPISVWETAYDQHRPYLDISDATKLIFYIIEKKYFKNETYNAVTTNATVRDIVKIISKEIGDVNVEFVNSKIMNQLSYHVVSKRIQELGFKFGGNLTKGIQETLQQLQGVRNKLPINITVN